MAVARSESRGIQFPLDDSGKRSTAPVGRRILAAALHGLDADAAEHCLVERDWRHAYPRHLHRLVELQAAKPQATVASCRAGLDAAWRELVYLRDGQPLALREAMATPDGAPLQTLRLRGAQGGAPARWEVPYKGRRLSGDALARRIDAWAAAGVIEASNAQALHLARTHPGWFDLSDRHLVLLGAGSEAGPLEWLVQWRANVVAIDLAARPYLEEDRPARARRQRPVDRAGGGLGLARRQCRAGPATGWLRHADPGAADRGLAEAARAAAGPLFHRLPRRREACARVDGHGCHRHGLRRGRAALHAGLDGHADRRVRGAAAAGRGGDARLRRARHAQAPGAGGSARRQWRAQLRAAHRGAGPGRRRLALGRGRLPGRRAGAELRAGQAAAAVARPRRACRRAGGFDQRRAVHHHGLGAQQPGAGGGLSRGEGLRHRGLRARYHPCTDGRAVGARSAQCTGLRRIHRCRWPTRCSC